MRDRFRAGVLFLLFAAVSLFAPAAETASPTIEAFVREGCPHCAAAEQFLAQLGREQPDLKIIVRDVEKESAALERLKEIARSVGGGSARVPAIYVGTQLIIGYSPEASTDKLVRHALAGNTVSATTGATCDAEESLACPKGPAVGLEPEFAVSFFGRTLALEDVGLPAFTLAMGLLDGFNPCSMWVLLLMISLLAPLNDRPRMLAIAGTFVAIQGITYFLFMAAWLNLFLLIGLSRASQIAIGSIALVAGLVNVKDFFAFKWGVSLSIPERAKPGIYRRIRDILHARSIAAAIAGAIVLAVLVQFVEFLCTSGFPALFTRILTMSELPPSSYYGYMLLYNAAYMFDDVAVLGVGVGLLSRHRLQEREGRILKLVSGVVMIGLGGYLLYA